MLCNLSQFYACPSFSFRFPMPCIHFHPDFHGHKFTFIRQPDTCTEKFELENTRPRPVLAFGYCRCLRLCVCVCLSVCLSVCLTVCLFVNHLLVRVITRHPFKWGSLNLDQKCKRPWLRSLLFCGAIDLDLQVEFNLKIQIYPIFELVRTHHPFKLGPPNLRCAKYLGYEPYCFGGDWPLPSRSKITLKVEISGFTPTGNNT